MYYGPVIRVEGFAVTGFGRSSGLVVLVVLLSCLSATVHAQNGALLGQSISWRPVNSPFTPDASQGAIAGGPGNDPNPGTPMYLCRARVQGSLTPGKWVPGNCNVPFGGSEQIASSYEVAYGSARWGGYRGSFLRAGADGKGCRWVPFVFLPGELCGRERHQLRISTWQAGREWNVQHSVWRGRGNSAAAV
jgi:hypothetical protein